MNTAEKIAALESLLVRVQKRAQEPRPSRAPMAVLAQESALPVVASPVPEASAAVVEPTPAVVMPSTPDASASDDIELDIDSSSPTNPLVSLPEPPKKSEPIHVPAPVSLAKGASGSHSAYVAKGGMSEELPDFELEDEEDEEGDLEGVEQQAQSGDEVVVEQSAPASQDDAEAEEFAIPLRPSVQMRAVSAPAPIEVAPDNEELELDHRPLASALPASTEEAIALHAQRIPPSVVPSVIEPIVPAPSAKTPAPVDLDEPEPTMVMTAVSLPEPPVEAPIPLVATPKPAAVVDAPKVVAPPAPVQPPVAPAKPALVPAPTAAVAAPSAAVTEPVVHEPAPITASADVVSVVSEVRAPAAAPTFAALLRRSLSLRVK